ncbi:caspase-like [Anopheles stephensi]|uniref:caspase-like n=1 Tax=Anopheles stephensi TaxID=30069 RepID=UPI001658AFFC|nr:caspase-like [Anopheles stephensi]
MLIVFVPKMDQLVLQVYNTNHLSRGTALIIADQQDRPGSEKDLAAVVDVFKGLKFKLRMCVDKTIQQLRTLLSTVASEDHKDSDCLLLVAMGHGSKDKLRIQGREIYIEDLWIDFIGSNCPSLIGKPKLVFIQCCRGTDHDTGARVVQTDATLNVAEAVNVCVPMHADLLVMYSSVENHVSYRSEEEGSWFIKYLCQVLRSNIAETDLLSLLTHVSYLVACRSTPSNKGPLKQMPVIHSMLSKQFYLVPK